MSSVQSSGHDNDTTFISLLYFEQKDAQHCKSLKKTKSKTLEIEAFLIVIRKQMNIK